MSDPSDRADLSQETEPSLDAGFDSSDGQFAHLFHHRPIEETNAASGEAKFRPGRQTAETDTAHAEPIDQTMGFDHAHQGHCFRDDCPPYSQRRRCGRAAI